MDLVLSNHHIPALLLVGISIIAGSLGAGLFNKMRIPQVVGYIVIGILIGKSGLNIIGDTEIGSFRPLTFLALGIIGFLVGSELSRGVFRKYGKQFFVILIMEGTGAFILVSVGVTAVTYMVTHDLKTSISLGILLGAISSATAPAATVDVLWEYKTLGALTTTIFAIVALDDALALFLFSVASGVANYLLGTGGEGMLHMFLQTGFELGGAILAGFSCGMFLSFLMKRSKSQEQSLTVLTGVLALLLGFALLFKVDLILGAMVLGMTLVNLSPLRSKSACHIAEQFARPIFILFFIVVGAQLSVKSMTPWLWGLLAVFVVGRSGGKILGAFLGARVVKAEPAVRKYLGLCLFSQAGVAVGLSILAGSRFAGSDVNGINMGQIIVSVVAATTFVVQLIGPPCVKFAVTRAGEVGRNVTEEDILASFNVEDVFNSSVPAFERSTPLGVVSQQMLQAEVPYHIVTDAEGTPQGMIAFDALKPFWDNPELMAVMVADDVMTSGLRAVTGDMPLPEALRLMNQLDLECLPVTATTGRYLGMLDRRSAQARIRQEFELRRQQAAQPEADSLRPVGGRMDG